jgi:uncharacterized protein DUF6962
VIAEAGVTLTDYGLAVECALLTVLLWRRGALPTRVRIWFTVFFGSIGLAALLGGTAHGFFPAGPGRAGALVWRAALLTIGVTATAAWQAAGSMVLSPRVARWVSIAAMAELIGYSALVTFVSQRFAVALANYLPAALFLLGAFGVTYRVTGARPVLLGMAGLVLAFVGSGIQQAGIALHPVSFDHNALYHLIEAVALALIFRGAQAVCAGPRREAAG